MPLNYSKWDALELSDDSDIEEHPNIDKRSMINWKKRDILEKREQRRQKIMMLHAEVDMNGVLLPRLTSLRQKLSSASSDGRSIYSSEVERLKTNPSDDKPPTGHAQQPTYDAMILDLLLKIWSEAKTELAGNDEADAWSRALVRGLEKHEKELQERTEECKRQAEEEEQEQKKKITSEDVHEGFSSGHINKLTPSPLDDQPKAKATSRNKQTVQQIEVLNPDAPKHGNDDQQQGSSSNTAAGSDDDDDEGIPDITASAAAFSEIGIRQYDKSWEFIQRDPSVLVESTTDSLLAEAFEAELKGDKTRAKRCIHQGLLVQYCRKLGRDGVRLFFQRMQQGGPKAESVFQTDVEDTYARIEKRVGELKKEGATGGERETIQLVAEDPSVEIGFNVPDGPPPENLVLEGEGVEDMNIDEVRAFLQQKWELWESFPQQLKEAMKSENLEAVNKVLDKMSVEEGEEVVEKMQVGGMLSFSESGVRDMTGK